MNPYRDPVMDEPAPTGFVALIWRWILLRRADRMENAARQLAPPKKPRVRTIHMVRDHSTKPFQPVIVEMNGCPGKGGQRPDSEGTLATSYWVCTPNNCCCEIIEQ